AGENARLGRWLERDDKPGAGGGIAHPHQHAVALVLRLAGDVHLGHQAREAEAGNSEMDVRRAPGIRQRPDRHKPIATGPVGRCLPVALKIFIRRRAGTLVTDIVVAAVGITLPDLYPGAGDRLPSGIETPTAEMDNSPPGGSAAPG